MRQLGEAEPEEEELLKQFGTTVSRDLVMLVCGGLLGSGVNRVVYRLDLDNSRVLKFEVGGGTFANVLEWETWQRVRDTEHAKWFAPCHMISPSGSVLIQSYARSLRIEEAPAMVPAFFTDLKRANFGVIGKRVVCRDYGSHLLMELGMTKRMKRAEWW